MLRSFASVAFGDPKISINYKWSGASPKAARETEEFKARFLYPGSFNFVLAGSKSVS